jgi:hypothetical protein
MCFGSSKGPEYPAPPSVVATPQDTEEINRDNEVERQRQKQSQGRKSTILSGMNQVNQPIATTKTLLGQ